MIGLPDEQPLTLSGSASPDAETEAAWKPEGEGRLRVILRDRFETTRGPNAVIRLLRPAHRVGTVSFIHPAQG